MIKKISILLFAVLIFSCGPKTDPKEVLFVCTHGAARSPIAAAYFDKIVDEKGLNYKAVFRGTKPDSVLTQGTIEGLHNDDFEINDWKPEAVSEDDIENAYKIVTFDCELPSHVDSSKLVRWDGTPPISKDYNKARNIIKEKVNELIELLPHSEK